MKERKGPGRPSKYNNIETLNELKEQVLLYRKENPFRKIRPADMVRFSKELHDSRPEQYHFFNKDVWLSYGKSYINEINEPLRTKFVMEDEKVYEIPNVVDCVTKFKDDPEKIISLLSPIETMLHNSLRREEELINKVKELKSENEELKRQVWSYKDFVLQMAHHSYITEYQEKFGLKNIISPNANKRNNKVMKEQHPKDFLATDVDNKEEQKKDKKQRTSLLEEFQNRRKQQREHNK
ncbi:MULTISPECIES: hypothetical protein [Bacillus cereus group]|uniref:hypothetical protein n=1 Tax=Bacillus cereus group TaxID=86661 RepID=UPI00124C2886|nr:hypothetical protein [Bacillus cereus]KAB2419654.1 hypothetical protein F8167_26820 [Bacillus cereus]